MPSELVRYTRHAATRDATSHNRAIPLVTLSGVILYTCEMGKAFGGLPGPLAHPCGRAARALDEAGYEYEHRTVRGGTFKVWTWPSRAADRAEIERLSGQRAVPILVLDDGGVITGSGEIASWTKSQRAAP
jgi:glutaredoxin